MDVNFSSTKWFTQFQLHAVIRDGVVPEWFHGVITRKEAEKLLQDRPVGCFLIRVSESRWGYTLSYRDKERCGHFMVDALKDGRYVIVGENVYHPSLQHLVDFHRTHPIPPFTQRLTAPCGQLSSDNADYSELLPMRHPVCPSVPWCVDPTGPSPPEDAPPALPHRALPHRAPPQPLKSPKQLYPCLSKEVTDYMGTEALVVYASPVPSSRKSFSTQPNASLDVPTLNSSAPLKRSRAGPPSQLARLPAVATASVKKTFQKMASEEEHMYAELGKGEGMAWEGGGRAENEYTDLPGAHSARQHPSEELPLEYTCPPSFAPGY